MLGDLREGEERKYSVNYCRERYHTNCATFFNGLSVMAVHSHLHGRRDGQHMSQPGRPHTVHCLYTTWYTLHHYQLLLT